MRTWPLVLASCLIATSTLAGEGFFEDPLPLDAAGGHDEDHTLVSSPHTDVSSETGTGAVVRAADPALTGDPTAPTAAADDNDTTIATTAYVQTEIGAERHLGSSLTSSGFAITTSNVLGKLELGGSSESMFIDFDFIANAVNFGSDSGVGFFYFTPHTIVTTGDLLVGRRVIDQTAQTRTLSASQGQNQVFRWTFNGDITITLPVFTAEKMNMCHFKGLNPGILHIKASPGDKIRLYGADLDNEDKISSDGSLGCSICMVAVSASIWEMHAKVPSSCLWIDGGA